LKSGQTRSEMFKICCLLSGDYPVPAMPNDTVTNRYQTPICPGGPTNASPIGLPSPQVGILRGTTSFGDEHPHGVATLVASRFRTAAMPHPF
jgi:hypothetical protein